VNSLGGCLLTNDGIPSNDSAPTRPIGTANSSGTPQIRKRRENQSNFAVDLLETARYTLTPLMVAHIRSPSGYNTSPALNDRTGRSEQARK
jgi:hypothetical protein